MGLARRKMPVGRSPAAAATGRPGKKRRGSREGSFGGRGNCVVPKLAKPPASR